MQKQEQKQGPIGLLGRHKRYPEFYRHEKDIRYKHREGFLTQPPKRIIRDSRWTALSRSGQRFP